jgi:positive regulator of sigma E activity
LTADAVVVSARPDGLVDLEFSPGRQCGACAGTCLWKRLQSARLDRLAVSRRFEPGTEVTVALPGRQVMLASIVLHGAPLFAILAGAVVGTLVAGTDLGTLIGSVLALSFVILGFGLLRRRLEEATLASLVVTPKP